jgi:hypothetical protein
LSLGAKQLEVSKNVPALDGLHHLFGFTHEPWPTWTYRGSEGVRQLFVTCGFVTVMRANGTYVHERLRFRGLRYDGERARGFPHPAPATAPCARTRSSRPAAFRTRSEARLGHVSEIADAEAPHTPRGCPFQAWSLGELLRLEREMLA